MNPLTFPIDDLAAFAAETTLDDIPCAVVDFSRHLLLDTVGALVGGLRYPTVRALSRTLPITLDGPVPFRRLVTWGSAATWLDADSGGSFHPAGARIPPVPTAHPAPHVVPGLLHGATVGSVCDTELLRAFVIATEIGMRWGAGTSLRPGLHPHGIHGPIAAAVATALLADADQAQIAAAIRSAGARPMAATLAVPMGGGTVRNLWTGLGTYYGVQAGMACRPTSSDHVPPAQPGLLEQLYSQAVCTDPDVQLIGGDLGSRWELQNSYCKPFACARWIHPALEALLRALAMADHPAAEDISGITVDTFAFAASLGSAGSDSDMHARFSVPRCIATVAVDGRLDADGFLPRMFGRAAVERLVPLVSIREESSFTATLPRERPTRVTVIVNGRRHVGEVRNASGNPDNPLTTQQIVTKYRNNVGPLLPTEVSEPLVHQLLSGHGGSDSSTLAALARTLVEVTG